MSGLEWTFAIVSLVAGLIIGIAINVTTVRRLRLRNRELRAEKHVKSAGNPDVENMSNHAKAMYYQMLDELDRGEGAKPPAKRGCGPETMKLVIWVCLAMGFAWVWCSYLLAWMDHPQIAESLSQVAVTEIIGVVLAYAIKSAVENLSKHNRWPDKAETPENPSEEWGGEEGGGID